MMSVPARSVESLPRSDGTGMVDMRRGGRVRAGTFPFEGEGAGLVTDWHRHDLHQLEYAFEGTVEVETAAGRYLLPPLQAVWIPAGLRHQTRISHRVRTISVFFEQKLVTGPGERARILAVTPVVREMILYASRWPIDRPQTDGAAESFFCTLGNLITESLEHEAVLFLPTSGDPLIRAAMVYTDRHLADVTVAEVAQHVGLSDRSFRRRFGAEVGLTWRSYLLQSRLLRAMALLAEPRHNVLGVATEVGFDSVSAFARAFKQHTGEPPSSYRARVAVRREGPGGAIGGRSGGPPGDDW